MIEWNTTQAVLEEIDYPDSDGEPMAETDFQRDWLIYLVKVLAIYFAQQQDVYVSGDLLIYYVEGDKRFSVAPDVFVVFGVEKKQRMNYLVWKEGKAPDVVIEIASPTTYKRDEHEKPALYRDLGVREYFQYDPMGKYLFPSLQGRRLNAAGEYEPIAPQSQNGYLVLVSEVLGLELHQDALRLRVYDPVNREYLRSHEETEVDRRFEKEGRYREREARLRAEEAHQRSEEARLRAEEERQHEHEARRRAEEERQREHEARLRAEEERQREREERQREQESRLRAEEERQRAEEARRRAEEECQREQEERQREREERQREQESRLRAEDQIKALEEEIRRMREQGLE